MIFERDIVPVADSRWQEGNATSLPSSSVVERNEPLVVQEQRRRELKVGSKDGNEFARKRLKDVD